MVAGALSFARTPGAQCVYQGEQLVQRRIGPRGVHGSRIQGLKRFTANEPLG
jgi:hypothetical protein